MAEKPVLLMAFAANDLPEVYEEAKETWQYAAGHLDIEAVKTENIDIKELANALIDHQENLYFFHFSGHATKKGLTLDGNRFLERVKFSRMLMPDNRAKHKLQWIFLNGCESFGHVGVLLAKGVKAVIATNQRVSSKDAAALSKLFYKCFFKHKYTLKASFEAADSILEGEPALTVIINPDEPLDESPLQTGWTLFINKNYTDVQNCTLADFLQKGDQEASTEATAPSKGIKMTHMPGTGDKYGLEAQTNDNAQEKKLHDILCNNYKYKFHTVSELYRLQCDRTKVLASMQEHFEKNPDHKFYLIQSCKTQSPEDLVRRFLLENSEKYQERSWHYLKTSEFENFIRIIDIDPNYYKRDIENELDAAIKMATNKNTESHQEIDNNKIKCNFISTCFKFNIGHLEQIEAIRPIIDHWLDGFNQLKNDTFQYISFFIVIAEGIHEKWDKGIDNQGIKCIVEPMISPVNPPTVKPENWNRLSLIEKLEQVEAKHLKMWLEVMLDPKMVKNDHRELIEMWYEINDLGAMKYDDTLLFDMNFCSTLMQTIWERNPARKPFQSK